jgi:hypothetical protein
MHFLVWIFLITTLYANAKPSIHTSKLLIVSYDAFRYVNVHLNQGNNYFLQSISLHSYFL